MTNLSKFLALEKLLQTIGHGRVNLELNVRAGEIVGITTTGTKRTLYNQSNKDQNTNQTAFEYVVRRVGQQLTTNTNWELEFKIAGKSDRIKSVEVTSRQTNQ